MHCCTTLTVGMHTVTVGMHPLTVGMHPLMVGMHTLTVNMHPLTVGMHTLKVGIHTLQCLIAELAACMLIVDQNYGTMSGLWHMVLLTAEMRGLFVDVPALL